MADFTNRMTVEDHGATGFVAIPASGATPLSETAAPRAILITEDGDLAVQLLDGSDNDSTPVAVVEGQVYNLCVTRFTAANTCSAIGLR